MKFFIEYMSPIIIFGIVAWLLLRFFDKKRLPTAEPVDIKWFEPKTNQSKIVRYGGGFLLVFASIVGFIMIYEWEPSKTVNTSVVITPNKQGIFDEPHQDVVFPVIPVETEKEYMKSTKHISPEKGKNSVYSKDYFKNPNKYKDVRLKFKGKIGIIEEDKGGTILQFFSPDYSTAVIVYYPDTIDVYKNDIVIVYGEGGGTIEGTNRFSGAMSWPLIRAKYIKKLKRRNNC